MKKLGLIQDHAENKWWVQDTSPIDMGPESVHCAAFTGILLAKSPHRLCVYVLKIDEATIASADTSLQLCSPLGTAHPNHGCFSTLEP